MECLTPIKSREPITQALAVSKFTWCLIAIALGLAVGGAAVVDWRQVMESAGGHPLLGAEIAIFAGAVPGFLLSRRNPARRSRTRSLDRYYRTLVTADPPPAATAIPTTCPAPSSAAAPSIRRSRCRQNGSSHRIRPPSREFFTPGLTGSAPAPPTLTARPAHGLRDRPRTNGDRDGARDRARRTVGGSGRSTRVRNVDGVAVWPGPVRGAVDRRHTPAAPRLSRHAALGKRQLATACERATALLAHCVSLPRLATACCTRAPCERARHHHPASA